MAVEAAVRRTVKIQNFASLVLIIDCKLANLHMLPYLQSSESVISKSIHLLIVKQDNKPLISLVLIRALTVHQSVRML